MKQLVQSCIMYRGLIVLPPASASKVCGKLLPMHSPMHKGSQPEKDRRNCKIVVQKLKNKRKVNIAKKLVCFALLCKLTLFARSLIA